MQAYQRQLARETAENEEQIRRALERQFGRSRFLR